MSAKAPGKRRLWIVLLVLVILAGAAVALAPGLAAPWVRGKIVAGAEENMNAKASLEDLSLALNGRSELRGFQLDDLEGRPVLTVDQLELDVWVREALRAHYHADVRLAGMEVFLRREADGSWNVQNLAKGGGEESSSEESSGELPNVSTRVQVEDVRVHMENGDETLVLEDFAFDFELPAIDAPAEFRLATNLVSPAGPAGSVTGQGEFVLGGDGASADGAIRLDLAGVLLERIQPVLLAAETLNELRGELGAGLDITSSGPLVGGVVEVRGAAALKELFMEVAAEGEGAPLTLEEPAIELALDTSIDTTPMDVTLRELGVTSSFLKGGVDGVIRAASSFGVEAEDGAGFAFENLKGEFTYDPERLGILIQPWLPGRLSGDSEEIFEFHLNGKPAGPDPWSLAHTTEGSMTFGLGRFEFGDFTTDGTVQVGVEKGRARIDGSLGANGGALVVKGDLGVGASGVDADSAAPSTLRVSLEEVQANSSMTPAISLLHPAFAGLSGVGGSSLQGAVSCELDLSYAGVLSEEMLAGGLAGLDLSLISGKGSFGIDRAALSGSPMFGELLAKVGVDTSSDLRMKPLEFEVQDGRVHYDKPWSWTLGDSQTSFSGSVGLDRSLDLTWSIPITEKLVAKHSFLESLVGDTLSVPIGGSALSPDIQFDTALKGLAGTAVEREVTGRLEEEAEKIGLGGILGGGSKEEGEGPEALLKRADALWAEGKQEEAAALYKKIRESYKLTPTYLLNKGRIKKRAQG